MTSRSRSRRRLPKGKASLIALAIALVVGYLSGGEPGELFKLLEQGIGESQSVGGGSEATSSTAKASGAPAETRELNGYSRLDGARLVEWGGNDGDSFKVRHDGEAHIFRLYFVDTPESNFRFPDRVGHQARYFKTSREKAVKIGKEAKKFTASLLQGREFTVYTRWESVMGSDRFHAFVVGPDGDFLSEELVERGLARIYTMPADLPNGTTASKFKAHLKRIESTARTQRVGGWR